MDIKTVSKFTLRQALRKCEKYISEFGSGHWLVRQANEADYEAALEEKELILAELQRRREQAGTGQLQAAHDKNIEMPAVGEKEINPDDVKKYKFLSEADLKSDDDIPNWGKFKFAMEIYADKIDVEKFNEEFPVVAAAEDQFICDAIDFVAETFSPGSLEKMAQMLNSLISKINQNHNPHA